MHRLFITCLMLAAASGTAATYAEARSRHISGAVVGPRGGVTTFEKNRVCGSGTCTTTASKTGPNGNTWSRTGTTTFGNGEWQTEGVITGPRGNTGSYSGSGTYGN